MAIYHLNVRGVAPARGSSAVKSAAYQSGEALRVERTGEVAAYSRTERVRERGIALPADAPAWASDRARLWNAAEAAHPGGNALVARRVEIALPRELDEHERLALVREYAEHHAAMGRAVDWAIHDGGDGNPHAHVLVSTQRIGPDGFVADAAKKSTKAYLVRRTVGGVTEERMLIAAEWKQAKREGWEKVFNYEDGGVLLRLTKAEAAKLGLTNRDRRSTAPVSVTVSRDAEQTRSFDAERAALREERAYFADLANRHLAAHAERTGTDAVTIDHRSNLDRGLTVEPTIHEGYAVTAMESRGEATELRAENEARRARNEEAARVEAALAERRRMAEAEQLPQLSEAEARARILALADAARDGATRIPPRDARELEAAAEWAALDQLSAGAREATGQRDAARDAMDEANRAVREEAARNRMATVSEAIARAVEALRSYVARLLLIFEQVKREAAARGEHVDSREVAAEAISREWQTPRPSHVSPYQLRMLEREADADNRQAEYERNMQRSRQRGSGGMSL